MLTFATLAPLLVGPAFKFFWAPAAKIHCPGYAHCDEEPPPAPGKEFRVQDGAPGILRVAVNTPIWLTEDAPKRANSAPISSMVWGERRVYAGVYGK